MGGEKSFKELVRGLVGQPVTFNFGINYSGQGTLAAVHEDCVEIHHGSRPWRQFIQLAHLRTIGEKE